MQGSPFRVTYTVMNLGAECVCAVCAACGACTRAHRSPARPSRCRPAYKISVDDVFPPQSFEVRDGAASHKEAELAPGANVTFGVTLVPRVAGVMTVGVADVRYRYRLPPDEDGPSGEEGAEDDLYADAHSSSSTPLRKREILRPDVYARVTKHKGPTAVFVALAAAALVLVPYSMFRAAAAKNDAGGAAAPAAKKTS